MSEEKKSLFRQWVEKYEIGPGMNDNNPHTAKFIDELAAEPATSRLGQRFGDQAREQQKLGAKKLYTGFDGSVGDGWIPILDRLAADLIAMGWDRDLHQVKEKYGGLRFYIGAGTDEIYARIHQAEEEAYKTCEDCGAPGVRRRGGWIKTLCDKCAGERWPLDGGDDEEDVA